MKAAGMHCIMTFDAHEHEILSKQPLLSLIDDRPTRFLSHHRRIIDTRQVTTCILQEAGSVGHTSAIRDAQPPR